ncbi:general secretion pathway protein GspB [Hahella aquimaris]|uniref:general secretion pathway protein GspB n=1 Tax=Hahella sp. HNIBRBA332 TaxID=3015983 RepID=UPI00273B6C0D|nr:general secretion pathway protein GspB [Hahella sp. HNIBRBA332]WLQ16922.1 general secretion pathway protein GspB [Hahella sp. HNIBRBA332]
MSYILEALRRSESERYQEKLPDVVQGGAFMMPRKEKRAPWALILILLLSLNAIALAIFFFMNRPFEKQTPQEAVVTDADPAQPTKPPATTPATPTQPQSAQPVAGNAPTQAVPVQPMSANNSDFMVDKVPLDTASNTDIYVDLGGEEEETINTDGGMLIAPSNGSTRRTMIIPGSGAAEATQNVEDQYPNISELSAAFQQQIPAMEFNSHIYSASPDDRRIMINNNYLREGQRFSGLKVYQITENGVVLDKGGQLFWIPVIRNWAPES